MLTEKPMLYTITICGTLETSENASPIKMHENKFQELSLLVKLYGWMLMREDMKEFSSQVSTICKC